MNFIEKHWGDVASVLGFALTIWFAWQAKTAAEQARDAADEVRDRLSTFDTIARAVGGDYDYRRDHAPATDAGVGGCLDIVLERHSALRQHLVRSQPGIRSEREKRFIR